MEQVESPLLVTPKADPSPTVSPWLDEQDFWICQEHFSESEEKCLDHCHSSGKFLGWTHDKRNLTRGNINYIPVVGHKKQNYDMHHICLALNECDSRSTIQVIPSTDEKFISLIIGVVVKTITKKDQTTQNIYQYLRFINSSNF